MRQWLEKVVNHRRFKRRVEDEVTFYTRAHGPSALERVEAELKRRDLRTRYRRILEAVAQTLRDGHSPRAMG